MSSPLAFFPLHRGPLTGPVKVVGGWGETSYFGGRLDPITGRPGNHGGMDLAFAGCFGQEMIAVKSGWLSQGWDPGGGGNWSSLTSDDGDYFGYGHASAFAPGASYRWVEAGTVIAYVGSTGASTGAHLHFAYRPYGASGYRDPYDILHEAADSNRFVGEAGPPVPVPEPTPTPTPPPEEDEEDMLKAPRKSWVTETGDWFALTPNGRFEHIDGVFALAALQTPAEGQPAEILAPIPIKNGVENSLADFYNSNGYNRA